MSLYLSRADVRRLTGREQRAAQCRQLNALGYTYEPDGDGWPLVLASAVLERHNGALVPRRRGPNFAALDGPR